MLLPRHQPVYSAQCDLWSVGALCPFSSLINPLQVAAKILLLLCVEHLLRHSLRTQPWTYRREGVDRTNKSGNSSSYNGIKKTPPTACLTCFVTVKDINFSLHIKLTCNSFGGCGVHCCSLIARQFWDRDCKLGPLLTELLISYTQV